MKETQTLNTAPNMPQHDDIYEALIKAHDGLSVEESAKVNAKLILLLINHIGNYDILVEAIEKASITETASDNT